MKRVPLNRRRPAIDRRRRQLSFQQMESRQLLAVDLPLGVTPIDTGEFLLGTVTVTPVFFESNGSIQPESQDWSAAEIESTLLKIRESVDWWTELLATKTSVHSLEFVIDDQYARTPVETGYEPIDHSSNLFNSYVGGWLTDLGYGAAPSIERAVSLFNDSQRRLHQTDWAFTLFVVDSSDDADGFFASGGFLGAFAYPGGLFIVIPSDRPVATYTHEMGHIFWARDEYSGGGSWTDQRGYYNAQNFNAFDNTTPGFVQQDSIMRGGAAATRAFDTLVTAESTLAMIGWRDSDGDGIFDLADVPIGINAIGTYDIDAGVYSFRGSAAVDTLANLNSEGFQSDITLTRISHLQYQIDGGQWQTVLSPNATAIDFDLQLNVSSSATNISWRAIDASTGVTSVILNENIFTPLFSGIGGGFAYLDRNQNGQRDSDDSLLKGTQFSVKRANGSDLFYKSVQSAALPDGVIAPAADISFTSLGDRVDGRVAVLTSSTQSVQGRVFQSFDTTFSRWMDTWSGKRKLSVSVPESTGRVVVDFAGLSTGSYGLTAGSYARAEAFDANGNRIDRVTSELVPAGSTDQLVISDPLGRIAKVIVYGHAETEILISSITFGQPAILSSNDSGAFSVTGLPDGQYSVQVVSPNLTYQFAAAPTLFQISGGVTAPIALAAVRVDSPRYNAATPGDVNGDQSVTVRDALAIINDLGLRGNRVLSANETTGFHVDVNNDGRVSAIDALRVINQLETAPEGEAEAVDVFRSPIAATTRTEGPTPTERATDTLFGPEMPIDWLQWNNRQNPKKSEMWNSAGERTSDQSQDADRSDSSSGTDALETAESGANTDLVRPLLVF